jgi:putative oxidoreductase
MNSDKTLRDVAVLAARLALGGSMAAHGAQKYFGVLGGPGRQKAAQMMHSLGLRPGDRYATMASVAEMTSGTLIALGALGPAGPAILSAVMLVAIETVHRPKGYWATGGGYEMNVMYLATALLLANHGYGSLSLDEVIGLSPRLRPSYAWLAYGAAVAGSIAMLAGRDFSETAATIGETIEEKTKSPA